MNAADVAASLAPIGCTDSLGYLFCSACEDRAQGSTDPVFLATGENGAKCDGCGFIFTCGWVAERLVRTGARNIAPHDVAALECAALMRARAAAVGR